MLDAFLRWLQTARCPRCKAWFALQFVRFDVDKSVKPVVGHDRRRHRGGYLPGWRGGLFGGLAHTTDEPFVREWGHARYLCRRCNLHLTVETHRDRR